MADDPFIPDVSGTDTSSGLQSAQGDISSQVLRMLQERELGKAAPAPVGDYGSKARFEAPYGRIAQEQANALGFPEQGPAGRYPEIYGPTHPTGEVTVTPGQGRREVPRIGGGPAAPSLPPELYGGFYYPTNFVEKTMAEVNAGRKDPGVATKELEGYETFRHSQLGIAQRKGERQLQGAQERMYAQGIAGLHRDKLGEELQYGRGIMQAHERELQERFKIQEQQRAIAERMMVSNIEAAQKKAADFKIDPNRMWKQKGGGAVFVATLGIALAEFGRVFTGGQTNLAHTIVKDAIDREMEAQKAEAANLRDDVAAKTNLFGQMRMIHGDDRLAEAQTRKELWHTFELYAQDRLEQASDIEQKQKQAEAVSWLNQQVAEHDFNLKSLAKEQVDIVAAERAKQQAAAAAYRRKIELAEQLGFPLPRDRKGIPRPYVIGRGLVAPGSDPEKVRNKIANYDSMLSNMDRAIAILKRNPYGSRIVGTDAEHLKVLQANIQNPYFEETSGKAVTATELPRVIAALGGDYTSLSREAYSDAISVIERARNLHADSLQKYEAQHIERGELTPAVNEKGDPEIYFKPEGGGAQFREKSYSQQPQMAPGAAK